MADLKHDHGFAYDFQGDIDVVCSPFFNVGFGFDHTVEDYLNWILPHLMDILDEQLPADEWIINGRPPSSPNPTSSPATSPLGITCVIVASLSVLAILLH
ncbi:hypothetical protein MA16_Dca008639 [Dendrobium catenatum]|uniref:Uncharacterized protein n=1 Tax=Dendrobium catenatum TaxID=906689 RepID=A0A2I0W4F1_9ASPA|nr:hypothetical protein MA16_Dca008639 [Dendrobium catenatum]